MKKEHHKFASVQLNDACLKFKLYLNKISDEESSQSNLQKLSHLAIQNILKYMETQQFTKQNYETLKLMILEKKNYFLLYIADSLLKNNKCFMNYAKKDLENLFKSVWSKVYYEPKNQYKLDNLKAMVKTWGMIFLKSPIEQSLKKWLAQRYNAKLTLSARLNGLFDQNYEKQKNEDSSKLQQLMCQLNKEDPIKRMSDSLLDLKQKIFQD